MAYEFTAASSQYLNTGTLNVEAPLTMSAWFFQSALATGLISSLSPLNSDFYGLAILSNGRVRVLKSGAGDGADTSTTASANAWNHACGIHESVSVRTAFLNAGGKVTNTQSGGAAPASPQVLIGARRINGTVGTYYTGSIAEVGIWNVALSDAEIASLAKGMTCDKIRPQNLVFYAPLIRDLQDISGGLTITNNNAATVSTHPRVYA